MCSKRNQMFIITLIIYAHICGGEATDSNFEICQKPWAQQDKSGIWSVEFTNSKLQGESPGLDTDLQARATIGQQTKCEKEGACWTCERTQGEARETFGRVAETMQALPPIYLFGRTSEGMVRESSESKIYCDTTYGEEVCRSDLSDRQGRENYKYERLVNFLVTGVVILM